MDLEVLRAAGVDTDDALTRLMGSQKLLERLLTKFLDDTSCERLRAAAAADDAGAALEAAHALKGVSGNLSLTELYALTSRQCELIRGGDWSSARELVPQVEATFEAVCAAIRAA